MRFRILPMLGGQKRSLEYSREGDEQNVDRLPNNAMSLEDLRKLAIEREERSALEQTRMEIIQAYDAKQIKFDTVVILADAMREMTQRRRRYAFAYGELRSCTASIVPHDNRNRGLLKELLTILIAEAPEYVEYHRADAVLNEDSYRFRKLEPKAYADVRKRLQNRAENWRKEVPSNVQDIRQAMDSVR